MRGVVFTGDRTLDFVSVDDPTPGPGEVVLEIKASGLCGSDLKFYRASKSGGFQALGFKGDGAPVIAGHEPCGVVAAVGPGVPENQARVGMRVMQHHYRGCGVCPHCQTGWRDPLSFEGDLGVVLEPLSPLAWDGADLPLALGGHVQARPTEAVG